MLDKSKSTIVGNVDILPCPFCGMAVNLRNSDTLYPYSPDRDADGRYLDWHINCVVTAGGCGAMMIGDSPEDCVTKWNKRT